MKVRLSLILLMSIAVMFPNFSEERSFFGDFGLSPNSMGTLGENFRLFYEPLSFLRMGIDLKHDELRQINLDFEAYGGPLRGDLHRQIWSGDFVIGPVLDLSYLEIYPHGAYSYHYQQRDSKARIIESPQTGDDAYPQDTFGFVETEDSETVHGPFLGLSLLANIASINLELWGNYSPMMFSTKEGGFFQTIPSTTSGPNSLPYYMWRKNSFELEAVGIRYQLGMLLGREIERLSTHISAYGLFQLYTYTGRTTVENSLFTPQVDSLGFLQIDEFPQSNLAEITQTDYKIEAGISLQLDIFQIVPIIDIAYVRIVSDQLYDYYNDGTKERWTEDFDYFLVALNWSF